MKIKSNQPPHIFTFPTREMIEVADQKQLIQWAAGLRPAENDAEHCIVGRIFERYLRVSMMESESFHDEMKESHRKANMILLPSAALMVGLSIIFSLYPPCG